MKARQEAGARVRSRGRAGAAHAEGGVNVDLETVTRVETGYPIDEVEAVLDAGLIQTEIFYEIVIPRRTLAHRKQKSQPLSPEQSDRLARVLRMHARATEALGDEGRATHWLHQPNRALGGRLPAELLGTDAGSRAVEKILGRIEHGIVS